MNTTTTVLARLSMLGGFFLATTIAAGCAAPTADDTEEKGDTSSAMCSAGGTYPTSKTYKTTSSWDKLMTDPDSNVRGFAWEAKYVGCWVPVYQKMADVSNAWFVAQCPNQGWTADWIAKWSNVYPVYASTTSGTVDVSGTRTMQTCDGDLIVQSYDVKVALGTPAAGFIWTVFDPNCTGACRPQ
jgi:hypothetical protein